jgi:predicted GNAT family N-acyltransferase
MPGSMPVRIVLGPWNQLRDDAYPVRHEVFVIEQSVPVELELDDDDAVSLHAVAYGPDDKAVATGRLLPDGHIGRMAVRKPARGSGVGGQVLEALIERGISDSHAALCLNAQVHARGFYEAHGFVAEGAEFMDAGIPHIAMVRRVGG